MSYEITNDNARLWVTYEGRLLGGYASNKLRSYVFPFYSPKGALVLQEAPPDHPHHQGIWAGLELDGHDLWNAGSFSVPRNPQNLVEPLGKTDLACTPTEAILTHEVRWKSVDNSELLHERRQVCFRALPECNMVTWNSVFFHPDKPTDIGQTKESGLGVRVPPHWESQWGGRIRNAYGGQGESKCFDKTSPWLSIEGGVVGDASAGLVMQPTSVSCPWFTRDYGVHVYNPARHGAIHLEPGEELFWSLRVLSYDGTRSVAEVDRLTAMAR